MNMFYRMWVDEYANLRRQLIKPEDKVTEEVVAKFLHDVEMYVNYGVPE
jgi:hypothetical protein